MGIVTGHPQSALMLVISPKSIKYRIACVTQHATIIITANMIRYFNVGLMMAKRLRRWAKIDPALGQRLVFCKMWPDVT